MSARRFSEGSRRQVVEAAAPLREAPRHDAVLETELLFGERVILYDEREGWAWVQAERDSHVGYLSANALRSDIADPTHRVRTLGTHIYPRPDYKAPPIDRLSMNAQLVVEKAEERFAQLSDGHYIAATHICAVDECEQDFVEVAAGFVGSPYLWGGRTSAGLDCSALIQLALQASGIECPRDSDMQEAVLGKPLPGPPNQQAVRRGDLVFWNGHVGVMLEEGRLLHANVHHMAVVVEPAFEAFARIETWYGPITSVRRMS
ncbi:MAG: C40 family peptidase [Hyphomicrobiaceae bacterium]|nr:C40 family peptidase [Hyphomicrobiaceae bacterium]